MKGAEQSDCHSSEPPALGLNSRPLMEAHRVAAKKKTWRAKLADSKGLPKVGAIEGKMTRRWGSGTMVVPAPSEVNDVMRKVPKGKLVTISEIRAVLGEKAPRDDRLSDHDRHFRLDRRPCRGRGRLRWGQADHTVLANAEIRRRAESQVSWRYSQPEATTRVRGPSSHQKGTAVSCGRF